MCKRHLAKQILKYSKQYPVIALVGPRQSGKTTLVKSLFPTYKYLSLENISIKKTASEDPQGFLATHGPFLILDEVQNVPELFSTLQEIVDINQEPAQSYWFTAQKFHKNSCFSYCLQVVIPAFMISISIAKIRRAWHSLVYVVIFCPILKFHGNLIRNASHFPSMSIDLQEAGAK